MNKIKFKNKEIKGNFNTLINEYVGLTGIVGKLVEKDNILIEDIINEGYNSQIIALVGEEKIIIEINFLKRKIYVNSLNKSFKEIYVNYSKKNPNPIGYEYSHNNRVIVKKNVSYIEYDNLKRYYYDICDNDINYNILIIDRNNIFDNNYFIQKVLYNNNRYNTIRDLLLVVLNEFTTLDLSIQITDSKGSVIILDNGEITQYLEYQEVNNDYNKVYLENGNFYIEKKVKEEYQDNLTSYIKKMGECHGKEKR